MMEADRIWHQKLIPIVFDDTTHKRLLVKMPYAPDNRVWLRATHTRHPEWLKQFRCWRIPRAWLEDVTRRLCFRHGSAYLIHPYREREVCAPACWEAQGLDCNCSCMGANHGQGDDGAAWYIVSEACAIQWGAKRYACRLLTYAEINQQRRRGVPLAP